MAENRLGDKHVFEHAASLAMWTNAGIGLMAPGLATLKEVSIPDLSAEYPDATTWLKDYFLNALVGRTYTAQHAPIALGLLRRAERAFRYYHDARDNAAECARVTNPMHPAIDYYYEALADWENFALQYQMATELYNLIGAAKAFKAGDGSESERLYALANDAKHPRRSPRPSTTDAELTLPVWFDGRGLHGTRGSLTYAEAADALRNLCDLARSIVKRRDDLSAPESRGSSVPPAR